MRSTLTEMEGSILCFFLNIKDRNFSFYFKQKLIENTRYTLGFFYS